ncbi:MAG: hypothetical protein WCG42_01000 [Parachlamydiaceae bacterium]
MLTRTMKNIECSFAPLRFCAFALNPLKHFISPLYRVLLCAFALPFVGCSSPSQQTATVEQEIKGRDYEGKRFAVYRVRVPQEWIRRDPLPNESLHDTTKAICEFIIKEDSGIIRIAIHNFASETIDQRIPPSAQIARWQGQFESLSPLESSSTPQSFSGYSGLFFKGVGVLKGEEVMVLGWSLQIAPEHYRMLSRYETKELNKEMRADVTIKAVGLKELMEIHQEEIDLFAHSFELIEEIPESL